MKNKSRYGKYFKLKDMPIGTYFQNNRFTNIISEKQRTSYEIKGCCISDPGSPFTLYPDEEYLVISPEEAHQPRGYLHS